MKGVHGFSDHLGFYRKGIPVISVTTGIHDDYHTTHDDAARINYTGLADIVKYLQALIQHASSKGKVAYSKVPGWYNFNVNLKIVVQGIDHMIGVGLEE